MEKPIEEWTFAEWLKKSTHDVREDRIDEWAAYGFFTPEGFVMLVPGVEPGGGFEQEMLRKRVKR